MASDKRKQSLYFPEDYLDEIREESLRQDRSMSWVVQKAWEIARDTIKQFPAANDFLQGEEDEQD
ncbi:TIGR04563 family protein [Lujinxingia litoralis]|uniref:TIGR04563 family protein n=1 Tax=Lujinxingia litoralis TaxID=2211119 RepID=A0A328C6P8_9DELT|nr:TIGR04563 family protein [Lujinxingia litoralis]RAL23615.1 TIGR04563 family protein [Lujinxingia litoralis]